MLTSKLALHSLTTPLCTTPPLGNHPECIAALDKAGADTEARDTSSTFVPTPLHSAAEEGCAEAVSALLRHGARKDPRAGFDRYTALHLAIKGQHVRAVSALLSAGADIGLSDNYGTGCLKMAIDGGDAEMLRY